MAKLITRLKHLKIITGIITALITIGTGCVYAYATAHEDYLLKGDISKILTLNRISQYEIDIGILQVEQGYSATKKEENKFNVLINMKRVQILGLKGTL